MLELITGGSGSGKSEFAENLAVLRAENRELYYIASMIPQDEECHDRIARHRFMRRNKGFHTVECYDHLQKLELEPGSVALLECLSNLLANEMYQEQGQLKSHGDEICRQAVGAILEPILELEKKGVHVIVVSNEIFSDGGEYDEETERYVGCLGFLNRELAKRADLVVELVCGIPLVQKGELPCCNQ